MQGRTGRTDKCRGAGWYLSFFLVTRACAFSLNAFSFVLSLLPINLHVHVFLLIVLVFLLIVLLVLLVLVLLLGQVQGDPQRAP